MDNEPIDPRRERAPIEPERADFDPAARGPLGLGNKPHPDSLAKPFALRDPNAADRQRDQQRQAYRSPDDPAPHGASSFSMYAIRVRFRWSFSQASISASARSPAIRCSI